MKLFHLALAGAALLLVAPRLKAGAISPPTPAPAQIISGPELGPGPAAPWYASGNGAFPAISAYDKALPDYGLLNYAIAHPDRATLAEATLESYGFFDASAVGMAFGPIQNALNSINPGVGLNFGRLCRTSWRWFLMVGLPRAIIKKYGVSKKAWAVFRGSRSPSSRIHTRRARRRMKRVSDFVARRRFGRRARRGGSGGIMSYLKPMLIGTAAGVIAPRIPVLNTLPYSGAIAGAGASWLFGGKSLPKMAVAAGSGQFISPIVRGYVNF